MSYVTSGNLGRYIGDLGTAWYIYLIMGGISLVLCIIFLLLLRYITAPLLYISFVLIFCLLLGGGFYVYYEGNTYDESDRTRKIMHGMGILCWILTGVYLILLLCCCNRIRLGIAIMEAASDFVKNTPSVFSVPFTFFLIIGAWVVFWVFSAVYVFSVGDVQKRAGLPMAQINWNTTTQYVWIYHLFGLFWISAFLIGCS
jgi:solute carrier family 44 (choline transporter-like protein), member 1